VPPSRSNLQTCDSDGPSRRPLKYYHTCTPQGPNTRRSAQTLIRRRAGLSLPAAGPFALPPAAHTCSTLLSGSSRLQLTALVSDSPLPTRPKPSSLAVLSTFCLLRWTLNTLETDPKGMICLMRTSCNSCGPLSKAPTALYSLRLHSRIHIHANCAPAHPAAARAALFR
jgi:hypothetical protein